MVTPSWDSTGADYEVLELVDQAVEVLSRLAPRSAVALPEFSDWDRPHGIFLNSEALTAHREAGWYPDRVDDYTEETRRALRHGERFTAVDFVTARRELERLGAAWKAALEHTDLLVLPTTEMPAPRVDELDALQGKGFRPEVAVRLTRLCRPINFLGLASVSVPCGFTSTGMPVGLQLVARDEVTALGAALAYQELSDWHARRPPLAG